MIGPFDASFRSKPLTHFYRIVAVIVCLWTLLLAAVIAAQLFGYEKAALTHARSDALTAYTKDTLFRKWASGHGGVYVPETDAMRPNPYLKVPNRDVETTGGVKLTLVNPAYMTRLVHAIGEEYDGSRGHITSLKATNPINEPDDWEKETLRAFESGAKEASTVIVENGVAYFRFMRPFVAEESCLKCHGDQGYKAGDVRGGVSISLPLAPFRAEAKSDSRVLIAAFIVIWLVGAVLILAAAFRIRSDLQSRLETERLLQDMNERLERSMRDTANDLATVRASLETKGESERSLIARLAETQRRLIETEKTQALGLVVAGIAHELNTPLGSICSSSASIDEIAQRILIDWDEGALAMTADDRNLVVAFIKDCRAAVMRNGSRIETDASASRLKRFVSDRSIVLSAETMEELSLLPLDFDLEPYLPIFTGKRADHLLLAASTIVSLIRCNSLISIAVEKAARDLKAVEQFSMDGSRLRTAEFVVKDLLEKALSQFDAKDLESITVVRDYRDSTKASCDPEATVRVFYNLIKNALQAMRYAGKLRFAVSEEDGFTAVEVADNGPTISAAVRRQIFTPFFTTKKRGEGLGLGLFISKQIVDRSGGSLSFASSKGETVFSVRLPTLRSGGIS